jgi:hypothetical protein
MDEVIIDDITSYMLNLSGYPDFSLAIKLYRNPEIGHLGSILFICKCSKKNPLSMPWATERVYKEHTEGSDQNICPSVLKMIPVYSSPASNNEDILPREVLPLG